MSSEGSPQPRQPVKRDLKQENLNDKVAEVVNQAGGPNYIQASYMKEICKLVVASTNEKLDRVQPDVASFEKESWDKAFKLCLAFLRRFRMDATISTIKQENPGTTKSTGYSRASEVDNEFQRLLNRKKA